MKKKKPDILCDRDDYRIGMEPSVTGMLSRMGCDRNISDDDLRALRARLGGDMGEDWEYVADRDDPWIDEALADLDAGNCVTHAEAQRYLEGVVREIDLESRRASRAC
jgi:hypothetical protein